MKDLYATRMTLSLRSHFFYKTGGEDELHLVKNPLDILIALRHHCFGLQKPTESYVKGEKFYDFVALYEWICDWRGFDLHPEWAARELLTRVIRDLKTARAKGDSPTVQDQLANVITFQQL